MEQLLVPKPSNWMNEKFFNNDNPTLAKITSARIGKNKWGKDELQLEFDNGTIPRRWMSVFGENLVVLTEKFGDDASVYIGKTVKLAQTEGKRLIYP